MKKINLVLGALVAAAAVAAPAQAQVAYSDIGVTFQNPQPTTGPVTFSDPGGQIDRVWWVKTSNNDQFNSDDSGYEFSQVTPFGGSFSVGNPFQIGTFRWTNNSIDCTPRVDYSQTWTGRRDGCLTSVDMRVNLDFGAGVHGETFNIFHDEIDNPSPDITRYAGGSGASVLNVDGQLYSVDILGFDVTSGWNGGISQWTLGENQVGQRALYGQISRVPEPSSVLLMASGVFGMIGFARRRNRNA